MDKEKCVYIVLSRSHTLISQIINRLKGDAYTHASLSLDKNLTYMFSFGRRREWNPFNACFKRESINEGLYKSHDNLPGIIMEIPVTLRQYFDICNSIESFLLDAHVYGYNYIGLAGNLIGSTCPSNTRFFCSEFVYYVLLESGVCDWGVPRGIVRPQTLLELKGNIVFEGNLKEYCGQQNTPNNMSHIFSFSQRLSKA